MQTIEIYLANGDKTKIEGNAIGVKPDTDIPDGMRFFADNITIVLRESAYTGYRMETEKKESG